MLARWSARAFAAFLVLAAALSGWALLRDRCDGEDSSVPRADAAPVGLPVGAADGDYDEDEPAPPRAPRTAIALYRVLAADDRTPIGGASISVRSTERRGDPEIARTTDEFGVAAFTFTGEFSVAVRAPGFVEWPADGWSFPSSPEEPAVTIFLHPAVCLSGRVIDDGTGSPVGGAMIEAAIPRDHHDFAFDGPPTCVGSATSADDGTFRLPAVRRDLPLLITTKAPGRIRHEFEWNRADPRRIEIRLAPAGTISGTVRDTHGDAVAQAKLRIRRSDCADPRFERAEFGNFDGTFVIGDLALGTAYDVWVVDGEFRATAASRAALCVVLSPESPAMERDFTFTEPAALTVELVDEQGAPVTGGSAYLAMETVRTRSTGNGAGVIEVPIVQPGPCALVVAAPGFVPQRRFFDLSAGERRSVRITLERGATLRGVVVDARGAPLASAAVWAFRADSEARFTLAESREAVTDEAGAFEILGCATAAYRVTASSDGFETGSVDGVEAPVAGLRIVLESELRDFGTVAFTLWDPVDPIDETTVTLASTTADGRTWAAEESLWRTPSRRFPVPAGRQELVITAHRRPPVTRTIDLASGAEIDLGRISVEPAMGVSGRVVDPRGRGVADAQVTALVGSSAEPIVAWTDPTGGFRLSGLPFRALDVRVAADGFEVAEFHRRAGERMLELTLR